MMGALTTRHAFEQGFHLALVVAPDRMTHPVTLNEVADDEPLLMDELASPTPWPEISETI
jgi:hypothetical protein